MGSDTPEGFTKKYGPVPIIGGPHDGHMATYEVILPFLDGGVPCSILVLDGHVYELEKDRKSFRYVGEKKEPANAH